MKVKVDDTVIVVSGKDKGKKGKVLRTNPKANKVIVEGINMLTKHMKPQGPGQEGGIINQEGALDASKVMYFCDKDQQGVRVGSNFLEDGSKVRVCKKCGEVLD